MNNLVTEQLPCLSERATFMSPHGYSVVKTHPYSTNKKLKGTLQPTPVVMPGYAFEAIPYRWMNRKTFSEEVLSGWTTGYDDAAEDSVESILGFKPSWIMDGDNQQAVIRSFFEPVRTHSSLVFAYLKHSPFQEEDPRRLLVGAAVVTGISPPPMWKMTGSPPFESSMWETAVSHSLRPDMKNGVLLPYQQLLPMLEDGTDVEAALAWQPQGRDLEFSYVTEHVSDDAAIEALTSLSAAVNGMNNLGIAVPASASQWIDTQLGKIWQQRGPTPGLGSVLAYLGVNGAHGVARRILSEVESGSDPWEFLENGFSQPSNFAAELRTALGSSIGRIWTKQGDDAKSVLRLLSAIDLSPEQVEMLASGDTTEPMEPHELLDNPYWASVCTYTDPRHVPFANVDRACFPPPHVTWTSPMPGSALMVDNLDKRRIEALLVEALELSASMGNTIVPQHEVLALCAEVPTANKVVLNDSILSGLDLDAASMPDGLDEWAPIMRSLLAENVPAYKLPRLAYVADLIRRLTVPRTAAPRFGAPDDARSAIDEAIGAPFDGSDEEQAARTEKAAGLAELHESPIAVLIGPAGTGKTTLLRALVNLPNMNSAAPPVLLAPTGKARVQLQQKVGLPAKTLASHLSRTERYDGNTGQYRILDNADRQRAGLVVIDEASMLTEEMLAATLDSFSSIKRLVLVGDPRQLPPIGAGRPFVDLVAHLQPEAFESAVKVASGYVELQVTRRQKNDAGADLALAKWFGGGELGPDDDKVWDDLASQRDLKSVRYHSWGGNAPTDALVAILKEELPLDAHPDLETAFALTYGGVWKDPYLNWEPGAGQRSEDWQVLTPTRSRQFGSVELNRFIKRTYRTSATRFASSWPQYIPRPIGPELIVRGDKVMQNRNQTMSAYPKGTGLDYVANGEIGVVIGRVKKFSNQPARVEFSSQVGSTYSYWPSTSDDPSLELAWAVTVHKSQGSEFAKTVVVLPSRVRVSRELLYTALTRHVNRVVILHDGTLEDLRELARPSASETAGRLTDLYRTPTPQEISVAGSRYRVDSNLVHVTGTGVLVRSKNEVIVADVLQQVAPGRWKYEEPFIGDDGTKRSPDFTIETALGNLVFWEHLGMLDRPDYAAKWAAKKKWYEENGVRPWTDGGGPNGTLIWTDDSNGVNVPEWRALAEETLGSKTGGARPKPAKKSAPRKPIR